MKAIKSIYNYLITFELFCLFLFFVYFVMSGFNLTINVGIGFTEDIAFSGSFKFDWAVLLTFVGVISAIYVLVGLNIVDTGFNDTGTKSIKSVITFMIIAFILINCMNFVLMKSSILSSYISWIDIFCLVIHVLDFIEKESE